MHPQAPEAMQEAKFKVEPPYMEARPPARTQAPQPAAGNVLLYHIHGAGHSCTRDLKRCASGLYSVCVCVCMR